ncbi:MAG TPA: antibiotic biosynthesis monooxygenase [Asanoa sp.]
MIARVWTATASADGAERYAAHFRSRVLPQLRAVQGFLHAYLLRRDDEIHVVTLWESMAAVAAFAGADPGSAVVEPQARAVLRRYDDRVRHFETESFGR